MQSQSIVVDSDGPTDIESLCMNCGENGITKFLPLSIPFYRDVVLMAFECPHCGVRNSEVQSIGPVQDMGKTYILRTSKPETSSFVADGIKYFGNTFPPLMTFVVQVPEIELEIPRGVQGGTLNTIEGVLSHMIESLQEGQEWRRKDNSDAADQVDKFIERVQELLSGNSSFTFILDDPAGNSFLQSLTAPADDPQIEVKFYRRTREQADACGVVWVPPEGENTEAKDTPTVQSVQVTRLEGSDFYERVKSEAESVMQFPTPCVMCQTEGTTNMCVVDIPHFKQTIIMAFVCDSCGYRNTEVKAGGPISRLGRIHELHITTPEDMSRDVLKSETAELVIPEIELDVAAGTLGGRFTTIEGLLDQVLEQLDRSNPFVMGDSAEDEQRIKFNNFIIQLRELREGSKPFTLRIDDPVGNSYIQSLSDTGIDERLKITEYKRTREQDEELGLLDMKTENYSTNDDNEPTVAP